MDAARQALCWSTSEGFWHRHPLLAWTLQLAVAVPLFLFLAPYVVGNDDESAFAELIVVLVARLFLRLKKNERAKRRLRPSPFFFWW